MKKIITTIVTIGSLASFAVAPMAAFAESSSVTTDDKTFCVSIKDKTVDDFKKWDARTDMMDHRRENRDDMISNMRAKFDDKRNDARDDHEEKFNDLVTKWEANAKTDAERDTIAQFKTELHAAILDRQTSVGAAVDSARQDRDEIRSESRDKIDTALVELKDAVSVALDKAQTDCTNGVSSVTVRTNFAADVKKATDAFKEKTASIRAEAKIDAADVRSDRKEEMQNARTEFRGFFENLRERFRAFFGIKAKGEVDVQ